MHLQNYHISIISGIHVRASRSILKCIIKEGAKSSGLKTPETLTLDSSSGKTLRGERTCRGF